MSINYSKNYFNKDLDHLSYQDIEKFFEEEREESNKIEFKSFHPERGIFNRDIEVVIKGICALLNSEGGIVIWGAPMGEVPEGGKEKVFKGALSPVTEFKEKDRIINQVSDPITPLPIGVNVKILSDEDKHIYVFEVQVSNYRPHQYKDIYWARLDGQTRPAPHYLVEALFKQITYPNLEGFIKVDDVRNAGRVIYLYLTIYIYNFTELQNEEDVHFRLMCGQGIFSRSKQNSTSEVFYLFDGHQLVFDKIDYIYFNAPTMHQEVIELSADELQHEHNYDVDLLLTFGGKKSPMKSSKYKLDLSKYDPIRSKDFNYLFISIEENELLSDRSRRLGVTKEEQLKELLGR